MSETELLSAGDCRALVSAYLGPNPAARVVSVDVRPLAGPRAGYMSDHLRVELVVQEGSSPPRQLRFFAKSLPRVQVHREYVASTRFYVKETAFYARLLKEMRDAQGDGGHDRWVPASYLVREDLIVLEDLSLQNYRPFSAREVMDVATSQLVLGEMARFHAATLVLEEKNRASGETRTLKEMYPDMLEERSGSTLRMEGKLGWFPAAVRCILKLMDHIPKYNTDATKLQSIKDKIPEVCQVMNTIVNSSSKFRNVVCHADIWASNILLRYSEDNKPFDVRFVDFQLVRYAPPACDVITFLFLLTDKTFRENHSQYLITHYYDKFAEELCRRNLDPEKLFPKSEFEESCEYYNILGVILAPVALPMLLLPPEVVDEHFRTPERFVQFMLEDRSTECVDYYHSNAEFRQRICDIIEEFVESCILEK
ncbi:hypothetical protein R5R35_013589 [Gryllus longicercus]|uniref:CHK kinase-like domain-containing protein n=1 Tax=Gryllus longicercus TaxID=2509291 RepID=A0AAN9Z3K9_9ORTH